MKELGITIDFAPVADVSAAPDNTVIGDRSLVRTRVRLPPLRRPMHRACAMRGCCRCSRTSQVTATAPVIHTGGVSTPPLDQLKTSDLLPYRTLIADSPVAVMVGHLQVPGLTGTIPASVSAEAYDLLRSGGYGGPPFTGPVFTDDLSGMAAITERYGVAEAVLRALQSGADIALWLTTGEVPAVLDRLEQAAASGELSAKRIDDALTRVAAMKQQPTGC